MRFPKVLKLLLTGGLIILMAVTFQLKINGINLMGRLIILFSKFRALFPYIIAQAKLESGNFKSKVYLIDHNYFGIKFINSPLQKNATKGLLSPEGNHYAHFNSDVDSLVDLLRIFEVKKMPVFVRDGNEYAQRLQERGYFTAGLEQYQKNINYWLNA